MTLHFFSLSKLIFLFLFWYWCYYPHTLKDSVSPLCGIFTVTAPLGRFSQRFAMSVCLCVCLFVCLRHRMQFFLGLSLALRSHDQFQACHWSTPLSRFTKLVKREKFPETLSPRVGVTKTTSLLKIPLQPSSSAPGRGASVATPASFPCLGSRARSRAVAAAYPSFLG